METMTELDLTVGATAPAITTMYFRFKCHSASSSRVVYFQVALLQLQAISQLAIVTQKVDPSWQDQDAPSSQRWTGFGEGVDPISKSICVYKFRKFGPKERKCSCADIKSPSYHL